MQRRCRCRAAQRAKKAFIDAMREDASAARALRRARWRESACGAPQYDSADITRVVFHADAAWRAAAMSALFFKRVRLCRAAVVLARAMPFPDAAAPRHAAYARLFLLLLFFAVPPRCRRRDASRCRQPPPIFSMMPPRSFAFFIDTPITPPIIFDDITLHFSFSFQIDDISISLITPL
jgi:hypothetical protein